MDDTNKVMINDSLSYDDKKVYTYTGQTILLIRLKYMYGDI